MSNDYSKMSDFEINCMIAKILHTNFVQGAFPFINDGSVRLYGCDRGFDFNPCNNPADAWPIIVANLIEVSPDYDFTDESEQELHATGLWTANHVEVDGKSYYQSHQNPLRASMIVFLMMQESKNDS